MSVKQFTGAMFTDLIAARHSASESMWDASRHRTVAVRGVTYLRRVGRLRQCANPL